LRIKAIALTIGALGVLPAAAALAAPAAAAPVVAPIAGPVPSESALVAKLALLLSDAPADRKAAELEGGAKAVPTVEGVAARVRTAGAAFKWTILGPVTSDGDTLTATLRREFPGLPLYRDRLSWKWRDGAWKLSNQSVCFLASQTMTACTVG
jgi:hypothetical protein